MAFFVSSKVKHATCEAVITRADGRVEKLGIIAEYHRNPLKNAAKNVVIAFKQMLRRIRS